MTEEQKEDWLEVTVNVCVRLGPNSMDEWPEERCAAKAREVWESIGDEYVVGEKYDWRVTE